MRKRRERQPAGPKNIVALDTETWLIERGCLAPRLVCVSLAWLDGSSMLLHADEAKPYVEDLLASDVEIIGHNIAYDMAVILAAWPEFVDLVFRKYDLSMVSDTKLREKLLHIAGGVHRGYEAADGSSKKVGYSLGEITQRRLGVTLEKGELSLKELEKQQIPRSQWPWRYRYSELSSVPIERWPAAAADYAESDALATLAVWQEQETSVTYLDDQWAQARAAFWLHLASCRGLTTDIQRVKRLAERWAAEGREALKRLYAAKLVSIGKDGKEHRHVKLVRERLELANPKCERTPTGMVKVDRDACEASGDPTLVDYATYSKIGKRLSTDVPLLRSGFVQPRFESLLNTGRTSSSPNVQNMSRKSGARECFIPRPGHVFAIADYVTFELRTFAQVCLALLGRSRLAETLRAGRDPHLDVAAFLLHQEYDAVAKMTDNDLVTEARQVGKIANFGFPGGMGPDTLVVHAKKSYQVDLTLDDAVALQRAWQAAVPEARDYFELIGRLVEAPEARIEQLFSSRYRGGCTFTQAANSLFQGLAADAAKDAGWEVTRACWTGSSPLFGCRVVNFAHDELVLEAPQDIAAEAAEELARVMIEVAQRWIPDVPVLAEPLLAMRWSKSARPIRVAGRLVPWEEAA